MFSTITQSLTSHPALPGNSPLRGIEASLTRQQNGALSVSYRLYGSPEAIRVPPAATPLATDGLWQHSCCELFIATVHSPKYEEFNFSPSGQWAHYRFNDYRERDKNFITTTAPVITWQVLPDGFQLDATLSPDQLPASRSLQVGITAVIEASDGSKQYWALKHCATQPDFHLRQSFNLTLPDLTP